MKRLMISVLILAVIVAGYQVWSHSGRTYDPGPVEAEIGQVAAYGFDTGGGNLVGIQPYMVPADYTNQQRFLAKLDAYFQKAHEQGCLSSKTVVVLPEYLGTWLVVAGENERVYKTATINDGMLWLAASNLVPFGRAAISAPADNRIEYALLQMKSQEMAEIYDQVLSSLAQKYRVTIVGGSIVLASPAVRDGHLVSGEGILYNVSPVYQPNGRAYDQLVFKSFPIVSEQPFLQGKPVEELPVLESPVGRLGVLICADSWFPEAYTAMQQKQAQVVVVPSYINTWEAVWDGYSGWPNPPDVDATDLNRLNLKEAWAKYAFAGRLPAAGIADGMLVPLHGQLWDLDFDGAMVLVKDSQAITMPVTDGAAMVNMWL